MYCISYGSFDYGQGRSWRLSQKLHPRTQTSSLERTQSLLSPVESSLMFAPPPSPLKRSCRAHSDSVKHSSRGHVFHFYSLLCEIAFVLRNAPAKCVDLCGLPGRIIWRTCRKRCEGNGEGMFEGSRA
jgi:hypothetical protein